MNPILHAWLGCCLRANTLALVPEEVLGALTVRVSVAFQMADRCPRLLESHSLCQHHTSHIS